MTSTPESNLTVKGTATASGGTRIKVECRVFRTVVGLVSVDYVENVGVGDGCRQMPWRDCSNEDCY